MTSPSAPVCETMDQYTPPGSKVVFAHPNNGYAYDVAKARGHLVLNSEYTVAFTDVGQSHTYVSLREFPGTRFNSVMFANVPDCSQGAQGLEGAVVTVGDTPSTQRSAAVTWDTPSRADTGGVRREDVDRLVDDLLIAYQFHALEQPQRNADGDTMKRAAMMLQRLEAALERARGLLERAEMVLSSHTRLHDHITAFLRDHEAKPREGV